MYRNSNARFWLQREIHGNIMLCETETNKVNKCLSFRKIKQKSFFWFGWMSFSMI